MGFNPFLLPRDGAEVTPLSVLSDGDILAAQREEAGCREHMSPGEAGRESQGQRSALSAWAA